MPWIPWHHRLRTEQTKMIIDHMIWMHQQEGRDMGYTMEDFRHEYVKVHFKELTAEERQEAFKELTAKEILEAMTSRQRAQIRRKLLAEIKSKRPQKRART